MSIKRKIGIIITLPILIIIFCMGWVLYYFGGKRK